MIIFIMVVLTAGLWLRYVYKLDRVEPEPVGLLLRLGVFGGLLSGLPAGELNVWFLETNGISMEDTLPLGEALAFSTFVGFNEELCKLLATMLLIWRSKRFDEPADAVVFATVVALGFAAFENLDYGMTHGAGVLLLRNVTSVPLHLGMAALWGYGLARWKFIPGAGPMSLLPWYLLASLIHAAYDTVIFATPPDYGIFALGVALGLSWWLIRLMSRRLQHLVAQSPFVRAGYCTRCGALNMPGDPTCAGCGGVLVQEFFRPCMGCGAKLGWEMKYCPRCGTKV